MVTGIRCSVKSTGIFCQYFIRCRGTINSFRLIPAHDKTSLSIFTENISTWIIDDGTDIGIEITTLICHQDLAGIDHLTVIFPDFQFRTRLILTVQFDRIRIVCDPHGNCPFRSLEFIVRIDLIQHFNCFAIRIIKSYIRLVGRVTSGLHIIMLFMHRNRGT